MPPTDLPSSNLSKGFSVAFVVLQTDGTDHFACRWLATHWQVAEAIAEADVTPVAVAEDTWGLDTREAFVCCPSAAAQAALVALCPTYAARRQPALGNAVVIARGATRGEMAERLMEAAGGPVWPSDHFGLLAEWQCA